MSSVASIGSFRFPFSMSRLALKLSGVVTLAAALAVAVLPSASLGAAAGAGLGVGAVAYAAAHYWLHRRLQRVRRILRGIRRHTFEDLTPPTGATDDELGLLLREVYRTGQTLENEIQELKEREHYRREFIGNVSHELKTPIFSAQGFAETLLDGALNDEEVNRTFLQKILNNVTRLENLARDLSAITKIETGEMEMSSEAFGLADMFEEVRDSLELKAEENDVTLQFDRAEDLPVVYGDRSRIRRVLVNLADNAIKYNEAGGTVTLGARSTADDTVRISVEDDGIGIPPDHLPRLTERFYRVDKSRSRNQGGTGLGLAIVKHILAAHDRELRVDSTPGAGSTFSFTLPTTPFSSLEPA
jgi:two-component system phosphate regulon sensor histidine kinase PhoR